MRRFRKNSVLFVSKNGITKTFLIDSTSTMQKLKDYFNDGLKYHFKSNTFSVSL
jgi:hypothetical protein